MKNREYIAPIPAPARDTSRRFSPEEVQELRRRSLDGETFKAIASDLGCSWATVRMAVRGVGAYKGF